jgi:hypothetical protein
MQAGAAVALGALMLFQAIWLFRRGAALRSVSDSAAEAGFPLGQQGTQAAAGPLATLAIVLACCVAVARFGPHPLAPTCSHN